ncbi:hypothetical protein PAXINDRAFT_14326 [Paxillus involutus ATCC 200175]|uniref:Uncharacterized protein n=1 Tax=Paxillus involutus ATCC 200175 TaxID=664439 RepID=A0A0C9TQL3_PAXIN|nr:hypothetical protein PAXINDRAFT_14326 [Paxillus involutus ATCC 200175]
MCPSPSADRHAPSRQEKSKRPSEHSRRLDNNDGDDHPPSATSHIESNKDMAMGTASHLADETLADVEHVEQLVLLGDNGQAQTLTLPAIGSGRAVNPIEYLCRAGEPVRDRNQRVLKAMVLELLIPHGYVKQSVLWKRLCHEAENLHFTILNWPEEIPVPDTQFDFHKLDANEVLKLLTNFLINRLGPMYKLEGEDDGENSKGKEKEKGKKGKWKAVEEPYVPQDGDDLAFMAWPRDVINIYRRGGLLAEAIPLVKSRTCPDKASKILLTVGGLHGKKPLASIVDEHDKDVIDEEWPGLAVKDTGFRNADNSDSARNAVHRANRLPPSTSDHDGRSIERPRSPSRHHVLDCPRSPQRRHSLDCPRSPQRHRSPPPRSPPPERCHSPHWPPDRLAPASRQKRGRIDDDVDSNEFKEVVNTHERVPVVKRAQVLPKEAGLHSADDDHRQREDGHCSRKEQHREYTRRVHSPGNATSSDVEIRDHDTSRRPARRDKTHRSRSPPFRQKTSHGHTVRRHHRSPSASPSQQDPSHGNNIRCHHRSPSAGPSRQDPSRGNNVHHHHRSPSAGPARQVTSSDCDAGHKGRGNEDHGHGGWANGDRY